MSEMKFRLDQHPAREQDRSTGQPVEVNGHTVPLYPEEEAQALYANTRLVAYVFHKPSGSQVHFILGDDQFSPQLRKLAKEFLDKQLEKKSVSQTGGSVKSDDKQSEENKTSSKKKEAVA